MVSHAPATDPRLDKQMRVIPVSNRETRGGPSHVRPTTAPDVLREAADIRLTQDLGNPTAPRLGGS